MSGALVSPRIAALGRELRRRDATALSRFWTDVADQGTPLVEPIVGEDQHVLVTFVWRGTECTRNAVVLGDFCGWEPAENRLRRVASTDVWHRTYRLRADTRTVYRLAENDSLASASGLRSPQQVKERSAGWCPDPLNRDPFPRERPWASALVLPAAPPQPWLTPRASVPAGTLSEARFSSAVLGNERTLIVYTSPGYAGDGQAHPLLVLFDAGAYTSVVPTPTILDNLLAEGRIPPLVAVFVSNPDQETRGRELPCHPPFVRFLTDELIPWVRARYRITDDPRLTIVGGSSYGGLAAAHAALMRPDVFGAVLSQSGSYWWKPEMDEDFEWLTRQYAAAERLPVRFYLDVGLLEGWVRRNDGHPGQLMSNRHLRTVLQGKGYPVHYAEFSGGHDYLCWRATLADGLLALLGRDERS